MMVKGSPQGQTTMRELLLQRVRCLLRDFSLKKGSAQYLSRIRFITTFLVETCGCHPDHIWPISYTNMSLFMAYIQSLSRSQSTFNGYAAAVEWFHDIQFNKFIGAEMIPKDSTPQKPPHILQYYVKKLFPRRV